MVTPTQHRFWKRFGALTAVFMLVLQFAVGMPIISTVHASGNLTGSLSTGTTNHNLSTSGTIDWAVWGYAGGGRSTSLSPDVRKNGGSAISSLTNMDSCGAPLRGIGQFPITGHRFTWTDGSPTTNANSVYVGLQHNSTDSRNCGFSFTVPADTTSRELQVYVHAHHGTGRLTATLSDNSAVPYTNSSITGGFNSPGLYTINYAAASAGQTLTVQ